ncbi:hypothetical protein [Acidaminobacter hydrogenoformans]|uniref:Uncharacterized protein n=1 Tax=Acidaminobacter hydrogenoformans DSM 2784 TaxID=1120920 RepID=A0A1G5RPR0_9FIRM|nr:hypothetical protein [Acidaminobacter hydrogenoformans]SCZ76102.1 hypothetical protein SAMN03080599_00068 [Acidaminobacter hydrogenoformans DSM 2784]
MPDQVNETKAAIEYAARNLGHMRKIEIPTSTEPAVYYISEDTCSYYDTDLKMAICYSKILKVPNVKRLKKESIRN